MSEIIEGDAKAIIGMMRDLHGNTKVTVGPDGAEAMVLPSGLKLESIKHLIDEYRDHPERREGVATMQSVASFVDYVNRFKNENTVVFASQADHASGQNTGLHAIIDHHHAGADGQARFGRHQCRYDFPLSEEWRAWGKVDGVPMSQEEFAELLEDRIFDVRDPYDDKIGESAKEFSNALNARLASPGELRDLGKGLQVRIGQEATQLHNVQTGESTLQFSEEHKDAKGQPLRVPGGFVLGVPVFSEGRTYQLCARLRYRISGSVKWVVKLHRADILYQHAFNEACEQVQASTVCPVFRGQAERRLPSR